jgi:hypothetical protein
MAIRTLAEGLESPEGPVALGDGSVVLVEIAGGTPTRTSLDGAKAVVARRTRRCGDRAAIIPGERPAVAAHAGAGPKGGRRGCRWRSRS